ncbi:MAG: T9SS type A sorting domain-containing protein, partial [Rhodothermus sp.]|nr:T9SS type A sorting domain-containing protein [Rhodothermus sp.]
MYALAIHPSNPDIVYAGGDIEGLWKTTDGGATWTFVNNNLATGPWTPDVYNIRQIKFDLNDSTYNTLYIATSIGLFKTTNGGRIWLLAFPDTFYNEVDFISVYSVAIDPSDPYTIFVGTEGGGLHRTTNGGATWSALPVPMADTTIVYDIYIDPTSPVGNRILYVGTSDGVFKSTDHGNSWSARNTGLPHKEVWRLKGVINQGQPILFLTLVTHGTPGNPASFQGGIFRSTDGASRWKDITGNLPVYQSMYEELFYFYREFVINPIQPNILYIGTALGYPDESLGAYLEMGIYKTTNGGDTWTRIDTSITWGWINPGFFDERFAFALAMAPSDTSVLYWGKDWLLKTTDAGKSWSQVYTRRVGNAWRGNGLEMMWTEDMAFAPHQPEVLYVGYDDMGLFKSTDGGVSFMPMDPVQDPYGGYDAVKDIVLDPQNPDHLYISRYEGGGMMFATGFSMGRLWRSTDGGNTWEAIVNGLPEGHPDLVLDPISGTPGNRTLYCAVYHHGVYKSTNSGVSWFPINNGLGADAAYAWKIALNPNNPQELYLGLNTLGQGGGVYRSTDGGNSWTKLTGFPDYDVLSIRIDPHNRIYIAATDNFDWSFEGGLFRSTDGGMTWTRIFSQPRIADVAISPHNPDILAAASISWYAVWIDTLQPGIYRSVDGGRTWTNITGTLQHTFVTFLQWHPTDSTRLFVGTAGGGLWYTANALPVEVIDVSPGTIADKLTIHPNYPNPFRTTTTIRYELPTDGFVRLAVYNVLGQVVARLEDAWKRAGTYTTRFDARHLPGGVYFLRLQTGDVARIRKII